MLRSFFFIIKLSLLTALVVWVASHPGSVRLEWLSYTITVHTGLFFLAALAVLAVAVLLYQIYRGIVTFPAAVKRYHDFQAHRKGLVAVTSGLAAVAAGDRKQALSQARRAQKYLPQDTGLSLLLQAQAARLDGRINDSRQVMHALSRDKVAGFLGLRGLLQAALNDEDWPQARGLATRGLQEYKRNPWLLQVAYRLALRAQDWAAALSLLDRLERNDVLLSAEAQSDRVALLIARFDVVRANDKRTARKLLEKAAVLAPNFVPLVARQVDWYLANNARKKAQSLMQKAWKANPHPDLAQLWDAVIAKSKADKPMARAQWAERLVTMKPQSPESYVGVGRVLLDVGLWGEAREQLMRAKGLYEEQGSGGSARLYNLLAMLERRQNHNESAAQEWLAHAREAGADKAWVCIETGRIYDRWYVVAQPHGAFNSIVWDEPSTFAMPAIANQWSESDQMAGLLAAE